MHDDVPLFWDAWDVEIYHLEKAWDAGSRGQAPPPQVCLLEQGPLRVSLQLQMALSGSSTLKQVISLTAASPRCVGPRRACVDGFLHGRERMKVMCARVLSCPAVGAWRWRCALLSGFLVK